MESTTLTLSGSSEHRLMTGLDFWTQTTIDVGKQKSPTENTIRLLNYKQSYLRATGHRSPSRAQHASQGNSRKDQRRHCKTFGTPCEQGCKDS